MSAPAASIGAGISAGLAGLSAGFSAGLAGLGARITGLTTGRARTLGMAPTVAEGGR
jgi:hypothetical protein